ncbi:hypothetical protein GDO81_020728 [Engystomops pustulosus]|uniref:Uncharacterized protein n=1 Tax=Engystomops pustulosus TaxID=76066 RepID=A0AAV6YZX4_ENGPU|nr:hypothetical protein GDO81_020728 [Engystomops pustulosus]
MHELITQRLRLLHCELCYISQTCACLPLPPDHLSPCSLQRLSSQSPELISESLSSVQGAWLQTVISGAHKNPRWPPNLDL